MKLLPTPTEVQRFDNYTEKLGNESGCWIWIGPVRDLKLGYGTARAQGKMVYAHRMAFALFFGEIPRGLCICHKCDTPSCVNPNHLFAATHRENMRDMEKKGRVAQGERHGFFKHPERKPKGRDLKSAKLSDESVSHIRQSYAVGSKTQKQLAEEFGVDQSLISLVVNKKKWRHVK